MLFKHKENGHIIEFDNQQAVNVKTLLERQGFEEVKEEKPKKIKE